MRRRMAFDGFSPSTTEGGIIPATPLSPYVVDGTNNKQDNKESPKEINPPPSSLNDKPLQIQLHYGNWPIWLAVAPATILHLGNIPFEFIRWPKYFDPEMTLAANTAGDGSAPWLVRFLCCCRID